MVRSLGELRDVTDEELIVEHDRAALHTVVGTAYYVQELDRRSRERSTEASIRLAQQSAETTAAMNERIGTLVDAMHEQLAIAKQSQADAERSERFTRTTAILSLVVSFASLAAAVAAIVVSVMVAGA